MSSRLTIVLIGIVVLPLVISGWLVGRTVRDEHAIAEQRLRQLATLQLGAVNDEIAGSFARIRDEATVGLASLSQETDHLRGWTDASLLAKQLYVISEEGRPIHPPITGDVRLTRSERDSLARTESVWDGGALARRNIGRGETPSTSRDDSGWFTWYWGDGLRWLLWHRTQSAVYAVELDRVRVLSEIINGLPDTRLGTDELSDGLVQLRDASNEIVYQWGQLEIAADARPVVRLPAVEPLSAWALEYYASPVAAGAASRLGMFAGLGALIVAVSGLAVYFHREQSRDLREAARRVSFVNQVSHELKTPLTNIRMYAELMSEGELSQSRQAARHLGVIVAESQRLSRLINNVLTMGGKQKRTLAPHRKPIVIDETVGTVIESFRPALEAKGFEIELQLGAAQTVDLDPDLVEQIVGNLVSNVEKYAAGGRYLALTTSIAGGQVSLVVEDRGPGIAPAHADRIFEPFFRVANSVTEGVSGTGIGLYIARDLARMHGGDLSYERTESGSRFVLTLPTGSDPR